MHAHPQDEITEDDPERLEEGAIYDATGYYVDGVRVADTPFLSYTKDALILIPPTAEE